MPRIDPLQLLNCLAVLLTPNGGILSRDEVQRLANLMKKFSKKLVSKCVYVLILKNTERSLLDAFMASEGWSLIQMWLQDANLNMNWALVKELLELLLVTPVDVERLKSNNIPKLVKSLSKRDDLPGIADLSNQLVQQWLRIVKDETRSEYIVQQRPSSPTIQTVALPPASTVELVEFPVVKLEPKIEPLDESFDSHESLTVDTKTFYKLTLRDGKQVLSKINADESDSHMTNVLIEEVDNFDVTKIKLEDKDKSKLSSKSSSSSGREKERSSSLRDKERQRSSSSNKDKHRDKDKDRRDRDRSRDKHRSNGSLKSSSHKSSSSSSRDKDRVKKERKETQAEKDKETLSKIQPHSLLKLPKIPKKTDDKEKIRETKERKEEPRKEKPSISIEVRKSTEDRPKTVKVYKAKMRSTGLEEEAKPPPPRLAKKPNTTTTTTTVPTTGSSVATKRASPIMRDVLPEKKSKLDILERAGSIKLIPPKPKPPVLQESDMFMDALTASANPKKEVKKRKRRLSVSKDASGASPPHSPSVTNGSSATSPIGLKNIAPPKFYQDTLETEDCKTEAQDDDQDCREDARPSTPTDNTDFEDRSESYDGNTLRGVLVTVKRKGAKKSIRWKADDELVEIQYFELDETERVNVSKTFNDMAKMDVRGEREALQLSRKPVVDDGMDAQIPWRIPYEIEVSDALAEPGSKSLEKDIQFAREKHVLTFFSKMHQDSPSEPDPESYQIKDPITIPVEDTDNPEHDFRNTPWPEPKGSPPPPAQIANAASAPPVFPNMAPGPYPNFNMGPPPGFQSIPPSFPNTSMLPPNMMGGGEWNSMNIPNTQMMPPHMGPPPEMMNPGMGANMFVPPQGPPEGFTPMISANDPNTMANMNNMSNPRFMPPFNPQGGPPGGNMFPPNNFNHPNRGGMNFRRGGGSGPWLRMNGPGPPVGPGNWNMRGSGMPHRGGRLCNNIRNKGFCRNRETCPFFHPN